MSESAVVGERPAGERALGAYFGTVVVMFLGIGLLLVYSIRLGLLVGPGVEESFGLALALMFLMAAVITHVVDHTYRLWPFGRRIRPQMPVPVSDTSLARFLRVVVLVAALLAIGYVIWGLLPLDSF